MRITIITVVYNGEKYLQECMNSVFAQTYSDIEYIVVDGNSTDSTPKMIDENKDKINKIITGDDQGLYDAINKGLDASTGDVVGLINADDSFASNDVVAYIADCFSKNHKIDGIYGDLDYVHQESGKIIRRWKSKPANFKDIEKGWMPAHPTVYIRRGLIKKYGNYALDFGTAADYDFLLRYIYVHRIKFRYLPILMVKMRLGGVSNQSLLGRLLALKYDYKALIKNKVSSPFYVLMLKKLIKFEQYFNR